MNRTQYKIYRAVQGAKVHVVMTFARLVGVPVDVHLRYFSQLSAKDPDRGRDGGHASDCAMHNGPVYNAGPCDCDFAERPA